MPRLGHEIRHSFPQSAFPPNKRRFSNVLHHKVFTSEKAGFKQSCQRNCYVCVRIRDTTGTHLSASFCCDARSLACTLRSEGAVDIVKIHARFDELVGRTTSQLLRAHKTSWQDGYYDTLVKTARQFEYVRRYIEQNPVVKARPLA